jgi:uncharacterized coiled-coil protein SlyX
VATTEELEQRISELEKRLKTVESVLRGVGGTHQVRDKFFLLESQQEELKSRLKRIER